MTPRSGDRDQAARAEQGTGAAPPRLADWFLRRWLPPGKRGDSILGDLHEEFAQLPDSRSLIRSRVLWYWQQTLRLAVRYSASRSPQPALTYPRSNVMWTDLMSDLKTAWRNFMRAPGAFALIVLTLAFAIGTATIGFVFLDLAVLRGLPVDDTSRVVSVLMTDAKGSEGRGRISGPDFLDYLSRSTTLEKMAVMRDGRVPLIRRGQSQTLTVTFVSADLFASMGQAPLRGRAFAAGDDAPGAERVAVMAHRYWQSEFAGRDDVIGQTLQIGRDHYTVIGVLSPDMEFGNLGEVDLWLPIHIDPQAPRDARNLRFLGRLKDGVTFEQARAEMAAIGAALATEHPRTNEGWTARLVPVNDIIGGDGFWVVVALFALSIGLLMAIATANVSNLVLVRTLARTRELAVRTALGARKGRLVRQLITEGLVMSLAAAGLSIGIAWLGVAGLRAVSSEAIFRQLTIDGHELLFVATLALICPVMFSIAPWRLLARPDMRQVLAAGGGRGTTASNRGRGVLVVVQVALAVILLMVSSLALRSMQRIYSAPTGMETSQLLVFGLEFNDAQYPDAAAAHAAAHAARAALQKVAAAESVEMVTSLPILGDTTPVALTVDNAVIAAGEARPTAVVTGATEGAARALGLNMLAGQWWPDGASGVAVVSEAAARRYLGGVDGAMGRAITITHANQVQQLRVVGVATDIANTDRTQAAPARVWTPIVPGTRRFAYLVRTPDPRALSGEVRTVVAAHVPAIPIEYLQAFDDALAEAASSDYVVVGMLSGFAVLALVLASTGLFGVVSFTVAQRTVEFGTRMALGASAGDVIRLVARDSVLLLAIGLAIGLAGGIGVAFTMQSVLFGLSPTDPLTLGSVIALLSMVTLTATALPAWKASRIDPVVALRAD